MLLTISNSESTYPITPVEQLKPRFWDDSEICLLYIRKQQQIFNMLLANHIRISVPVTNIIQFLRGRKRATVRGTRLSLGDYENVVYLFICDV